MDDLPQMSSPTLLFTGSFLVIEVSLMLVLSLPQAPGVGRRLVKLFAQSRLVWWLSWMFLPCVILFLALLIHNIRWLHSVATNVEFDGDGDDDLTTKTGSIDMDLVEPTINAAVTAAALFCLIVLRRLYLLMIEYVHTILLEEEKARDIVHHFVPPSIASLKIQLGLWRWLTSPKFIGLENIDPSKAPFMFIGNHTLYGIDMPLLVIEIYEKKGIFMRGLGDYLHFFIPGWRDLMCYYGAVPGTRENCTALLNSGQSLLIYPGGAREVFKRRKDAKYSLMWKDRLGFAKLAIQHGVSVVPVSSVGTEEMMDIIADVPLDWMLKAVGYEKSHGARMLTVPIPSLPKPQRVYFKFGAPIDTSRYKGDFENMDFLKELRDECSNAIQQGVELLKQIQSEDPERDLIPRVRNEIKGLDISQQLHSVSRHLIRSPRKSKHKPKTAEKTSPQHPTDTQPPQSQPPPQPPTEPPLDPSTQQEEPHNTGLSTQPSDS